LSKFLDSLRSRIILIIFLSILPLLGIFIGIYLEQRRNEERHAREHVLQVAQQFSLYQEHQVNQAYRLLATLAQFPSLLELDRAACSAKLAVIVSKDPDLTSSYTNLILADPSGRVLGSARALNGPPVITDFFLLQRVLDSKDFVAGELQVGKAAGKAALNLGYPVLDRTGQVKAVLLAGLNLDWFRDLAAKMRLPDGSSICIIDNQGTILARLREPEKWVGQSKPEAGIIKTVLAQREGITESRGVDGNNRFYAFTPLAGLPKGGYVYVGIPTQAIYAQTTNSLKRNLLAVAGVAALALLLAWLLGYPFVMRRFNILIGAAQKLAAGDLSARTGLDYREGEIDNLARSFDGMAQALQLRESQIIRQHDILGAINRIFHKALVAASKEELARTCLDEILALTAGQYGLLAELNDDRLDTIAAVNPDYEAPMSSETSCPILLRALKRRGLIGKVLAEGVTIILNEPAPRYEQKANNETPPRLTSFLAAPLTRGSKIMGILGLVNKNGGYNARDRETVETVAKAMVQAFMGKMAEDKLLQFRREQELILSSTWEGILGLDLQGRHTFVNPAAAAMLGYTQKELIGRPSHSVWHHSREDGSPYPEDDCHFLETLRGMVSPNPIEEVFWRRDGSSFPVESNKNPIIKDGRVVGAVINFRDISARKEAERRLRANAEYYHTLVETSPNAIITIDQEGQIIAANLRAASLTGYSVAEITGRQAVQLAVPEDRGPLAAAFKETLDTGDIRNRTFTMTKKKGGTFLMEVSASLIANSHGQPPSIMAIFRDITERQRGEQALKQSEEKYRLLVSQMPAVVYKAYADCYIDFIDDKVKELTGYTKEDFDTRRLTWKEMILPEDLPIAKEKFIEALKSNKAYVREYRIRRKDGEIRWIHNRGQIFCNGAGKIDYVSGVLFDITSRKQAEQNLFRVTRALRALSECNQALVHATEETAFLQDVCRIILEVTGYRLAWVGVPLNDSGKSIQPVAQVGRTGENPDWINRSWDENHPRGRGPGGAAIRTGKTQVVRHILQDPALAPWYEEARRFGYNSVIVLPLVIQGHAIAILDILSEDVDAFDSEEIRLLEELAGNVSQGIVILRERDRHRQDAVEKNRLKIQLLRAQKMEAIGTLAGGIAHDFNNILTAIVGYSELTLMNLEKEQDLNLVKSNMQGVLQASERAKELVQQILTISRKREQQTQPVQIDLIIKEVLKLLRASMPTTIEIRHRIDPRGGVVMADPTQIHQVLMNICTNAYHAMRETGGALEIILEAVEVDTAMAMTHPHLREGPYLKLSVWDTGQGMEPEILDRIFEPYYTTKEPNEGTGLGLAVVHGIVTGMGGAIEVSSRVGQGTTFLVYLPRFGQAAALESSAGKPIITSEKGEHILFVDDESEIAIITEEILKRLGYQVTVKTSSLEALALFKDRPRAFDLVITDQTMPQLTGVQLAQEIIKLRPHLPIILCTGFSETVSPRDAKASGIQEYLLKPLNVGELAKAIHRLLHPPEKSAP
jgi:PAS domain S-box-containing protein